MGRVSIAGPALLLVACTADASGLGSRSPDSPPPTSDGGAPVDASPPPESRGADGAVIAPPLPSAPSYDWRAGDYPPDRTGQAYLELGGIAGQLEKTRGFKVHVPAGYDPAQPFPVLFALHGYQQNAVSFAVDGSGLVAHSDRHGYVLVMPNGLQEDGVGGSFNGGACCGEAALQRLDDVALVRAIFAELTRHVHVDPQRVYAAGYSNGAFLSHRLACEAADLFAAVVAVGGALGALGADALSPLPSVSEPGPIPCTPSSPVAVLAVHGTADAVVPYRALAASLGQWAEINGCSAASTASLVPASGGDTGCATYPGCRAGVEVTGCSVAGGGHCWFGDATCGTGDPGIGGLVVGANSNFLVVTEAAWAFVSRFRR